MIPALGAGGPEFNSRLSPTVFFEFMNRLYFTMTTVSTVGYGDISPRSNTAKVLTISLQAIVTIGLVTTLLSIFKPK